MSNKIKNAIVNAIESTVNDGDNTSISTANKTSYSDYIYALFLDGINTAYKANKRCKYDYQLMETLLKRECESEISNILWFTHSINFTILVNAITNIIDD